MCTKVCVCMKACMSVHATLGELVGECNFLGIIAFPLAITSPNSPNPPPLTPPVIINIYHTSSVRPNTDYPPSYVYTCIHNR